MSAGQLSAGTVVEVKCLFAIDAIAAVYRADPANWRKSGNVTLAIVRHDKRLLDHLRVERFGPASVGPDLSPILRSKPRSNSRASGEIDLSHFIAQSIQAAM
jgi:hypothetical protein